MRIRESRILLTATVLACTVGSCSRCNRTTADDNTPAVAERSVDDDPADILSHPVRFDAQSVAEYADLVSRDTVLGNADIARVIVVAQSAVNHVGEILDELQRNDDPADTYNTLAELDTLPWPGCLLDILDGLDRQPLDATERQIADDMRAAYDRNQLLRTELTYKLRRYGKAFNLQ